jgi:hypothetical protein
MTVKLFLPVSLTALTMFVAQAHADTLRLRDGRVINGVFVGGGQDSISFQRDNGRVERFIIGDIDTLSFGSSGYNNSGATPTPQALPPNTDYNRNTDRGYRDTRTYDAGTADRTDNGFQPQSTPPAPPPPPGAYSSTATPPPPGAYSYVLPAGTVVSVRTIDRIESDASRAGETFPASLDYPVIVDGRTIASKGNPATLQIVELSNGGRITGHGEISLALVGFQGDDGRQYSLSTNSDTLSGSSRGRQSAGVIGGGAALGAIIGAVAGGGAGAAIGAASGAAVGTGAQLIRGTTVKIPAETRLNFTLNRDVALNY